MSELILQAVAEVCVSTVEQGGVAGAEFSTDLTFSQWFCFLINACSSLRSLLCLLERNTALQGKIQGNLGDFDAQKMIFPSESCNSVSKGTFREFRPFFRPRKFSPRVPPEPLREPSGNPVWEPKP